MRKQYSIFICDMCRAEKTRIPMVEDFGEKGWTTVLIQDDDNRRVLDADLCPKCTETILKLFRNEDKGDD